MHLKEKWRPYTWGCVVVVGLLVLVGADRQARITRYSVPARVGSRCGTRVEIRDRPISITPSARFKGLVSEECVVKSLCGAAPVWRNPPVSSLLHELRV